jgi:N,N'-diacetyllegionaminate synthase
MLAQPVLIIAEAGVNHNGDFELAKRLVQIAADAGADVVKFQTFKADKLVTKNAKQADYQKRNLGHVEETTQYDMLKKLEMPEQWHHDLAVLARKHNIAFLSTGFDEESLDFLATLNMPLYKVPSGELTNKRYLQAIAGKGKPVVLSTGMADMQEVRDAVDVLCSNGVRKEMITVLHCNTEYPTPMEDVNLKAMRTISDELGVSVGYSDHTQGIEVSVAAVALGATVIEKHFTIDRSLPGPDHAASLEPNELALMVTAIRNIERAIAGDGVKTPSKSERPNIAVARKSIHLKKAIARGETITEDHLVMKRPGDGISPMQIDRLIGLTAKVDLPIDQKLLWEHFEK